MFAYIRPSPYFNSLLNNFVFYHTKAITLTPIANELVAYRPAPGKKEQKKYCKGKCRNGKIEKGEIPQGKEVYVARKGEKGGINAS
ncbi:uncharacterized protein OCT59_007285 [Rhizophagus irregularis]|uniref:uncharacterized protein n=1 Tax=Rhizophagus irregularis TaxID=588596 RepID=UPI00331C5F8E|nr:hypothetical protein OCT59_007285 [Rhizophagus irregularis]